MDDEPRKLINQEALKSFALPQLFGFHFELGFNANGDLIEISIVDGRRGDQMHKPTSEPIEHDDRYCADSNAEEPEGYDIGCHDGTQYGPCGAESCYGQCEDQGLCPCGCHEWDKS